MIINFADFANKYLDNTKKYNKLTDSVKNNAGLTREQLINNLKEIALAGNRILEESKSLMSALGLIDKTKNSAPEFALDDTAALYDFARKCNKSGDLPWSDEDEYDGIDDCFLALEILDIVIKSATQYKDLNLKIRASELFSHHCINSAAFLVKKEKEACAEILKIPYESLPAKTFKDAKAKLSYSLIVFNYSLLGIINDAEEDYNVLFESFKRAEIFNEKYKPRLNHLIDMENFASDKKADAFETDRDEVWDNEWKKPEIKAWANTFMENPTREQARELAKRWCNYALNINMIKSYTGHFSEHLCVRNISINYAKDLNIFYSECLGKNNTHFLTGPKTPNYDKTIDNALSDGNMTIMLVGWAITGINIIKHEGGQTQPFLNLLCDIAKKIIDVQNDENWYKQIKFFESLIAACAIICKFIEEMPENEKRVCLETALKTISYIKNTNKEIKKGISIYRKELGIIARSCFAGNNLHSRRKYIESLFSIASLDHLPTYAHCLVVANLNKTITKYAFDSAPELLAGINNIENIIEEMELAGLGHDLGKIFQIHSVSQCARPLTETEYFDIIRKHNEAGSDILNIPGFELQQACALNHHAHSEGNGHRGYPDNANVKSSPYRTAINITHISDVLSAISDNLGRYYAKPRTVDEAYEQIQKDSQNINGNVELDPSLVSFIIENKQLNRAIREILSHYNEEAYWLAYKTLV